MSEQNFPIMSPIAPADLQTRAAYLDFGNRKASRGGADIYAAFQPFNEATRALHALMPTLIEQKPERILVVWDRTAYLSNLLQALFPAAKIDVTWDSETDVLGRTGYAYWMAGHAGPTPWICDHTRTMPFADKTFDLVVSLDVLHRVEWPDFLNEIDRLLKPEGAAVFPHIHMANAQPEPFFERGGTYRLGREYQTHFDAHPSNRVGWVQSEPALFRASYKATHRLATAPEHPDYNGLAAWVPATWLDENGGLKVGTWAPEDLSNCRGFLNPLVEYRLNQSTIRINPEHQHGFVQYMFDRHPVYEEYLRPCDNLQLSDLQVRLLHSLETGRTAGEFQRQFGLSDNELRDAVAPLTDTGALFLAPFTARAHAMQTFLGTNKLILSEDESTLPHLMALRGAARPEAEFVRDEETLIVKETLELVDVFASRLLQDGIQKGDRVLCQLPPSWEACVLAWSVAQVGAVLMPFEESTGVPAAIGEVKCAFRNLEELEQWLEAWDETEREAPEVTGSDPSVVLHTSGTTGAPKGVVLTHRQLVESAMAMAIHFELDDTSVLMMHSGMDTMSGFRNSAVLPWVCGGGVAICPVAKPFVPDQLLDLARARKSNVLAANPTMFRMLLAARAPHPQWQAALCTGAPLAADIKAQWLEQTGIPLLNYYGLTETTGFCIAEKAEVQGGIGVGVLGVSQIQNGQLRLFSTMIASTYITPAGQLPVADPEGWYWTGDEAAWNENGTIELRGRGTRRYKTSRSALVRLDDLEAELLAHSDVLDAHSVVVPHHESETAKVYLKLAPSGSVVAVEAWLAERWGHDKTPLHWQAVADLPRNAAGKVASNFGQS